MKRIDKYYFLILGVSIFLMLPLINNLYFAGDDTWYHIANIMSLSKILNFKDILNLKIFPSIANNFGYGSGIFYPQLAHLVSAFIYKVGNISIFSSIKLTDWLIIFLSGIFMYRFMKLTTKDNKLSFISTLFYMTAPYKIYDLFIRDAMQESLVFVFIPIIFLSIYYLFNKEYKKFYIYFVIGYVLLIQSHLVMTVYVTIFLGLYLILNWQKFWNKKNIKVFLIATITVILVSLHFVIPLIIHKFNGNYVVFAHDSMANKYGVYRNALNPLNYFFIKSDIKGLNFINYVALYLFIYLIIILIKNKSFKKTLKEDTLFSMGFLCTILGIWMSSLAFPWFIMPDILLMIQFPWRLGTLTAFGISILVYYSIKSMKKPKRIIIISIISCICFAAFSMSVQEYKQIDLNEYDINTLGMGWQYEYLPVNALENKDYLDSRSDDVLVISGNADCEVIENNTPYLKFNITNVNSNTTLELPRLYYIGYEIKAIYSDYEAYLSYEEDDKGFISINVDSDCSIEVSYTGTNLFKISNIISIISLCIFILIIIFKKS